jgi:hypothetical protein
MNIINQFEPIKTGIKTVSIAGATNPTAGLRSNVALMKLAIDPSKRAVRKYLTRSSDGNVSMHRMDSFLVQTTSAVGNFTTLTAFLATSMNESSYTPNANEKLRVFADGNRGAINRIMAEGSQYNAVDVKASVSEEFIPSDYKTWDNVKMNGHVDATWAALTATAAKENMLEEDKTKEFNDIWDKYQALEAQLKERRLLVSSNILVAHTNSVAPCMYVFQNTTAGGNKFFDGTMIYGTLTGLASYAPNNNTIAAPAQKTDATVNESNGYKFGTVAIKPRKGNVAASAASLEVTDEQLQQDQTVTSSTQAYDSLKTPEICSAQLKLSDHVGRPVNIQMVMMDSTSNGKLNKRSTSFGKIPSGSNLFLTGTLYPFPALKGTLAIVFEARNVEYNTLSNTSVMDLGDIGMVSNTNGDVAMPLSLDDFNFDNLNVGVELNEQEQHNMSSHSMEDDKSLAGIRIL